MNIRNFSSILLMGISLLFAGCARRSTQSDFFMRISTGMEKEEIIRKLGKPTIIRGSIKNNFNQNVEILEYEVHKGQTSSNIAGKVALTALVGIFSIPFWLNKGTPEIFWLYFYDNKLVQWGKAGDWEKAADNIAEIRFR